MNSAIKKLIAPLAAAGAAALVAATAHAQSYPTKPVKFLVPFAAGGPADTMARLTAQTLQQGLNQTIVIDNRPGAGGIIGARAAALADPDGYTLMYGNTASLVVGPAVYANPGYDPVKAFAPIALVAVSFNVLAVNPKFPAHTVQELIAYAKKKIRARSISRRPATARRRTWSARCSSSAPRSTSCIFPTKARPPRSPTSWADRSS